MLVEGRSVFVVRLHLRAGLALEFALGMEVLLLHRLVGLERLLSRRGPLLVDGRVLAVLGLGGSSFGRRFIDEGLSGIQGSLGGTLLLQCGLLGGGCLRVVALGRRLRGRSLLKCLLGSLSGLHERDELGHAFRIGSLALGIERADLLLISDGVLALAKFLGHKFADHLARLHLAGHLGDRGSLRHDGCRGVLVGVVGMRVVTVVAVMVVVVVVAVSPLFAGDISFGEHHSDGQEEAESENHLSKNTQNLSRPRLESATDQGGCTFDIGGSFLKPMRLSRLTKSYEFHLQGCSSN